MNKALKGIGLEQYSGLDTMKAELRKLGYTSYNATNRETMRLQLISRNKPNGH